MSGVEFDVTRARNSSPGGPGAGGEPLEEAELGHLRISVRGTQPQVARWPRPRLPGHRHLPLLPTGLQTVVGGAVVGGTVVVGGFVVGVVAGGTVTTGTVGCGTGGTVTGGTVAVTGGTDTAPGTVTCGKVTVGSVTAGPSAAGGSRPAGRVEPGAELVVADPGWVVGGWPTASTGWV
ncbi:MAG: hypothetical protein M3326_02835, partial [Actinomycetota bacterium]|nr:hypothetical protein [Actinomycetota bacterium]